MSGGVIRAGTLLRVRVSLEQQRNTNYGAFSECDSEREESVIFVLAVLRVGRYDGGIPISSDDRLMKSDCILDHIVDRSIGSGGV